MTVFPRPSGGASAALVRGSSARITNQMETFQESVVGGILASAGCNWSRFQFDEGIDLHVTHSIPGDPFRPLHVQLKAVTEGWNAARSQISASLSMKRYDELRATTYSMPSIMVIMDLPREQSAWSRVANPYTLFKHCTYWVNLYDAPERTGTQTVSVSAP